MDKINRRREIVKIIAIEPWIYSCESLAKVFKVSQATVQRDLDEMKDYGFEFILNKQGLLYLKSSGWYGVPPMKASTLRQMEILRILTAMPQGLSITEIYKRFNRWDEEVSNKTLERALKELEKKNLVKRNREEYLIRSELMLPPLQLEDREKSLLIEALNVAGALAPIQEEMKTLEAKLKLYMGERAHSHVTMLVHGRTPTQDIHLSQCCFLLEEAARNKSKVTVLYRKNEESARLLKLNPLGIVYYWVLDNWYLIAQDEKDQKIKTYLVSRIIDVSQMNESFEQVEGFDLRTWYQYSWGVFRDQNPNAVTIRFHNQYSTLERVKSELAKRMTCTLTEENQGLIMQDQVEGLDELAVWLRGFGASAEVLDPPKLREKIVWEFRKLFEMYGGESHGLN